MAHDLDLTREGVDIELDQTRGRGIGGDPSDAALSRWVVNLAAFDKVVASSGHAFFELIGRPLAITYRQGIHGQGAHTKAGYVKISRRPLPATKAMHSDPCNQAHLVCLFGDLFKA